MFSSVIRIIVTSVAFYAADADWILEYSFLKVYLRLLNLEKLQERKLCSYANYFADTTSLDFNHVVVVLLVHFSRIWLLLFISYCKGRILFQ